MSAQTAGAATGMSRPGARQLTRWLTAGLVLGSALGVTIALLAPATHEAEAILEVVPTSALLADATSAQVDNDAFVQSELLVVNGPGVEEAVEAALGREPGSYSASQVGTTTNVQISAESTDARLAERTAEAVVSTYTENRQARLRAEIDRTTDAVDAEIVRLEEALADQSAASDPLQSEYGRLLGIRSSLFRAEANVPVAVNVVQDVTPLGTGGIVSRIARPTMSWGLFGMLVALAVLLVKRGVGRRVTSTGDLAGTGVPVLQPEVPVFRSTLRVLEEQERNAADLHLLTTQILPASEYGSVVLFGATGGVGTSSTAAVLAAAAVERGDVLLVLAADFLEDGSGSAAAQLGVAGEPGLFELLHSPLTPQDLRSLTVPTAVPGLWVLTGGTEGGTPAELQRLIRSGLLEAARAVRWTVVVDAPALAWSTAAIELARRADVTALVVGRGRSHVDEVVQMGEVFQRQGIALRGALLAGARRRGGSRRSPAHDVGSTPPDDRRPPLQATDKSDPGRIPRAARTDPQRYAGRRPPRHGDEAYPSSVGPGESAGESASQEPGQAGAPGAADPQAGTERLTFGPQRR